MRREDAPDTEPNRMKNTNRIQKLAILAALGLTTACAAEVGSSRQEAASRTEVAAGEAPMEASSSRVASPADDWADEFSQGARDLDSVDVEREEREEASESESSPVAASDQAVAAPPVSAVRKRVVVADKKFGSKKDMARPKRPMKKPMAKMANKVGDASVATGGDIDGLMVGRSDVGALAQPKPDPKPIAVPSESNDNAEEYTDHGVNPMTETSKDRFSTFSVDVDTGSYTVARRKLNEGVKVPSASVRVEEFVNYFGYDYPRPDSGAFGVHMEAAPSPFDPAPDRLLLRVGVQGKTVSAADRKPVHLTFLVDVSGSMNRPDKLGLAKTSLKTLVDRLGPKDSVALVTYAGANRLVLADTRTTRKNKAKIKRAIDDLRSGGGTAMSSGMELAYKQAIATTKKGHVSRVLVMSDGDANIGPSSHRDILAQIRAYVDEGVTLSTIGFGMGNYRDTLMEQLSNKGNGNYYYIDSVDEAKKVFGEQADGTLEVIAKDVKLQVEFNPEAVSSYRLVGYENRDIADEDFRNDAVDAGEIGAGHTVTAFYEVVLTGEKVGDLGYVRIRAKKPDGYEAAEQIFTWRSVAVKSRLSDASSDFQFGAAVVAFAEKLRKSPYAEGLSWDLISEVAQAAAQDRKDRNEFVGLVDKARRLHGG